MSACLPGNGPHILQLITLSNTNSRLINHSSYSISQLRLTLITKSIPLGFDLVYQNNQKSTPGSQLPLLANPQNSQSLIRKTSAPLDPLDLLANLRVDNKTTDPIYPTLNLASATNGSVTRVEVVTYYNQTVQLTLQLDYTYVSGPTIQAWTLLKIQVILTDK